MQFRYLMIDEVRQMLRERAESAGGMTQLSYDLRIAAPYLSEIIAGRRDPGPKVCAALKLKATKVYEVL